MKNKPVNRKPARKYLEVIDRLVKVVHESEVTKVVVAELVGIEYITLDKYLRKERNVNNVEIAKRMVATAQVLEELVKRGELPIPPETNARLRSSVVLEIIHNHITNKTV